MISDPPPPKVITTARGYTRTVHARLVTWRCEWCTACDGCEVTEWRYPGPLPRYHDPVCPGCGQACKREAQNALAAGLMRRRRQAEEDRAPYARRRGPGRPRKLL